MLHYSGDAIFGKSRVFLGEATLDFANQRPLFLRHLDIVAAVPAAVKTHAVNDMLWKSLEKNTFPPNGVGGIVRG
jgi:hypothetical protein